MAGSGKAPVFPGRVAHLSGRVPGGRAGRLRDRGRTVDPSVRATVGAGLHARAGNRPRGAPLNLGDPRRTSNDPLLPQGFLRYFHQPRFKFSPRNLSTPRRVPTCDRRMSKEQMLSDDPCCTPDGDSDLPVADCGSSSDRADPEDRIDGERRRRDFGVFRFDERLFQIAPAWWKCGDAYWNGSSMSRAWLGIRPPSAFFA